MSVLTFIVDFTIMVDIISNETLCTSTVRKPCLPRKGESVYFFLRFTIIDHRYSARLESVPTVECKRRNELRDYKHCNFKKNVYSYLCSTIIHLPCNNLRHIISSAKILVTFVLLSSSFVSKTVWMACCSRIRG